ncbi:glutathione S-transferase family protein [Acidisphaera sp. L21]|uniref:glutathione S-transferase family protein n=1 Tax=Acidisphaera sp. L21 TaxID=1641851 RepID=UPI00131BE8D0|nr:glutathione S-transferase N-terminal domain-containing protein [Acidisphaera sp. L21]
MSGISIWGRANSVNVQKVLWCCAELGVTPDRINAGMAHGHVDTPEYRAMNPNGRVPTLVQGDFVLWESNAIIRYLTLSQIEAGSKAALSLYPAAAIKRAPVERWLDWVLTTMQPAERPLFWNMVRTTPEDRDAKVIATATKASADAWAVLEAHLTHGGAFVEGDSFTLADIVLGAYARRWFGVDVPNRPVYGRLRAWYDGIAQRFAFQQHIALPLS